MEHNSSKDYFSLLAEVLRLRSRLYDKATSLPTLSAAMDDVRRLSEDGRETGVVYLGIDQAAHLEEIFGWNLYDRMLSDVAAVVEKFATHDSPDGDILALRGIRSDEILVFTKCMGEPMRYLAGKKEALLERLAQFISTGTVAIEIVPVNFLAGHALISRDARVRLERQVYEAVDLAARTARESQVSHREKQYKALRGLLEGDGLVTLYQPIFHLETGIVYGHEALTRGPEGSEFESAETLFAFAEKTDLLMKLERHCRRRAFDLAQPGREPGRLFINCSVQCLYDQEFQPELLLLNAARAGLEPHQVVFEITERVAVHDWERFRGMLKQLKQHGFAVAIDDMGAGYSNLKLLAEIEPDFLKLDISLVKGADKNLIKLELLRTLQGLAQRIGAQVIAEGLETQAEHRVVRELGIPYGQGFFLARPAPSLA